MNHKVSKIILIFITFILCGIKLSISKPAPQEDDAGQETLTIPAEATETTEPPINPDEMTTASTETTPKPNYSYNEKDPNGPSKWPGLCNAGNKQSPIAYKQGNYERKQARPTIVMTGGYEQKPKKIRLINNGHGVEISFEFSPESAPKITGGPLSNKTYVFDHFHYHTPCEHQFVLNSKACALEIHMVHYNEKYGSVKNSVDKDDGLAVIGILYISSYTYILKTLPFVPLIKNIINPNSEYYEEDPSKIFSYFDILQLMSVPRIVSYKGSLTTPNCAEGVTWIIFSSPHLVLESDMRQLREVLDSEGNKILSNNRPVQPLNGRKAYLYAAF